MRYLKPVAACTFVVCIGMAGVCGAHGAAPVHGLGAGSDIEQIAQGISDLTVDELQAEQQRLFEAMLAEPDDLDITFRYAAVSSRLGDPEAAITALERMLLFNPDLPRVRLELGVLYFRMQSYDVAEAYFRQALEVESVPPEVEARVNRFLAEIDDRRSPVSWTGQIFAGLRYQDNANAAPGGETVTLGGLEFRLDDESRRREDVDLFTSGSATHRYRIGLEGDALVSNASVYANAYLDDDDLNVALLAVDSGPRIDLARFGREATSIRPFGHAEIVRLGQQPYYYAAGVGLGVSHQAAEAFAVTADVRSSLRDFTDTGARPNGSDRDGLTLTGSFQGRYAVSAETLVTGVVRTSRDWADEDFESRVAGSATLGVLQAFDSPIDRLDGTWVATAAATVGFSVFDAAEPLQTDERRDRELRLRAGLTAPITDVISATAQVEQTLRHSNYDINKYTNSSVLGGLSARF